MYDGGGIEQSHFDGKEKHQVIMMEKIQKRKLLDIMRDLSVKQ
jgi:hypothetical protein